MSYLRCLYFNLRSIRGKSDNLELKISEYKADVVFLTETWLDGKDVEDDYQIDGYELFVSNRRISNKQRGGGVAIYMKNKLNIIDSETYCRDGIESVKISIKLKKRIMNMYSVYKAIDNHENNENIIEYLEKINGKNNVIVGDFNFPDINWKYKDSKNEEFYNFIKLNQMWQHVKEPTRIDKILDLVITSYNLIDDVKDVKIIDPIERGDHRGIVFKLMY